MDHQLWTIDMSIPSLIFWAIFVLPLVAFLIWIMRQDKRKGILGLIVLGVIVVGCITYMILEHKAGNY